MIRNDNLPSLLSPPGFRFAKERDPSTPRPGNSGRRTLMIDKGKVKVRIPVQNVLFVKAEHVYCRIFFTNDQRVLQRTSLEKLQARLPADRFVRVHRSFLVNVDHVRKYTSKKILIGDVVIPIGRTLRDRVVARLNELLDEDG